MQADQSRIDFRACGFRAFSTSLACKEIKKAALLGPPLCWNKFQWIELELVRHAPLINARRQDRGRLQRRTADKTVRGIAFLQIQRRIDGGASPALDRIRIHGIEQIPSEFQTAMRFTQLEPLADFIIPIHKIRITPVMIVHHQGLRRAVDIGNLGTSAVPRTVLRNHI